MSTEAIANRLIEICRAGNWNDAYRELFASDADVTRKDGVRELAEEMCVYEVKDGKIVAERFFYSM